MKRYARLISLPEIGEDGIKRLNSGSVLVIGCGALGSMAAMYLAASGVGEIGIADFDNIELSNLQRQLFYSESEVGRSKSATLTARMHELNSDIKVTEYRELITDRKAESIFPLYDFVIDGSDNPATKLMTDRISSLVGVPCCIGGVRGFEGQVMSCAPHTTRYSDIFGTDIPCQGILPCSIAGVLGPVAGAVASIQAAEAIKHLTDAGEMLYDKILTLNLLDGSCTTLCVRDEHPVEGTGN